MKIVFGAGGTGGHIIPALAVAQYLVSMGATCSFIGNRNSMEERLCSEAGYPFNSIQVQKLYRKLTIQHILFPYYLLKSIHRACHHLRNQKADAVFCTGGFVSGPVAIAAIILRIPLFFHESNSYPGIVIRFLARYSKQTFTSFVATGRYLKTAPTHLTGVPIKPRIEKSADFRPQDFCLSGDKPILLVVGGSQGSLALNKAVDAALPKLAEKGFELIWQTGTGSYTEYKARYEKMAGVYIFDFSNDLPLFYTHSTIALTRAGAMTIAELEASRLPAILVPLPTSAENHQLLNARAQQSKGCALLLEQKDLNAQTLVQSLETLYSQLESYKSKLNEQPANNAAETIATVIIESLKARSK